MDYDLLSDFALSNGQRIEEYCEAMANIVTAVDLRYAASLALNLHAVADHSQPWVLTSSQEKASLEVYFTSRKMA
ncbi:hypothetical protein L1987_37727 [Smallanthus sonchifolius]|uniref:Uncharacterized protein n=1 Tax=Smallanthus sonchifolius TaxID=185202 RepID=A0ACB9HGQ3_9ASTR|nr:hypothetical protein L1987_37727 [Smallanthus sonchifolius]